MSEATDPAEPELAPRPGDHPFCNGVEVFDEQLLSELPCQVLHCTVTDSRLGACTCGKDEAAARQRWQGVRCPQLELSSLNDFEDQSDPSTVLAATVGCLLVLSALVMLWHWETTSGTSVTMLAVMTLVFATVFGPWHWWLCTAPPFDGLQHSVSMWDSAVPSRPLAPALRQ